MFAHSITTFPAQLRPLAYLALVGASLALVYATWIGCLSLAEPACVVIPLKVDRPAQAQLYFDRGNGLSERDSSIRAVETSDEMSAVDFPVPAGCFRKLRFDPLTSNGTFTIGEARLEDSLGKFIATFSVERITPLNEIAQLRLENGLLVGTTVADATDPQLTIGFKPPVCVNAVRIPCLEALAVLLLVAFIRRQIGS